MHQKYFLHINYLIESWQVMSNELIIGAGCHMTSITCWVWPCMVWHAISRTIINARMSLRKKKRSCPFSSAKGRPKKAKSTFDKEWATKLPESDKGSFYNEEKLLYEPDRDHETSEQAWAQIAVKYNCKKLSKQVKLTKRSGQSWKVDQLFRQVAFVKEIWIIWKTCYRVMDLVHRGLYDAKMKAAYQSTNSAAVEGNLYLLHVNCRTPIVI